MSRSWIAGALPLLVTLAVPAAEEHQVTARDDFFEPQHVTITAGDSVRWTNEGNNAHNVVEDGGAFRCAESCDSGSSGTSGPDSYHGGGGGDSPGDPSSANWSFALTFDEPGEIGYYCEVHGSPGVGMFGTITVEEAESDFSINGGLGGSWFNPETGGQGFLFDFITTVEDPFLVVYWFTYDLEPGGPSGQRWLYAEGGYEEGSDTVVLEVNQFTGGAFDQAEPGPDRTIVGMAEVPFDNCTDGTFSYELDFDGDEEQVVTNSFDITALSPDIPENCEAQASQETFE